MCPLFVQLIIPVFRNFEKFRYFDIFPRHDVQIINKNIVVSDLINELVV